MDSLEYGRLLPPWPPPTKTWEGVSGRRYHGFVVFPLQTVPSLFPWFTQIPGDIPDMPGIIAKKNDAGGWDALYIGESGAVRDRLVSHERATEWSGATHIHVRSDWAGEGPLSRLGIEADLQKKHTPSQFNRWSFDMRHSLLSGRFFRDAGDG